VLLALLVVHVIAHIDRNMLMGFSHQITRDQAISNARYGFLAIVPGNLAVGAVSDRVSASGSGHALTYARLATDLLAIFGAVFFALAARGPRIESVPQGVFAH
jgi:predicted transporter